MLYRLWLLFAQVCTVCVAALFTISTLRPEWLNRPAGSNSAARSAPVTVAAPAGAPPASSSASGSQITFAPGASAALPSVVKIATSAERRRFRHPLFDDPAFERFFGRPRDSDPQLVLGEGSGVIVRADGYILTNKHVIEGAQNIQVELSDKRVFRARLVGTDPETDLAVIKVDSPDPLPAIVFGDSNALRPGDVVLAIGNPFGVFGSSVTMGIVSATGRTQIGDSNPFEHFIQTDAAINQGNSGGALVNTAGQLVGINTSIFTRTGDFSGIGFAIPTAVALPILEQLIATGRVERGFLGVTLSAVPLDAIKALGLKNNKGAFVQAVAADGPGSRAGLRPGDVIIRINRKPIEDRIEAVNAIAMTKPGTTIPITVVREGAELEIEVTLAARPTPRRG
ncbi:MAG: trypsin-like peptidase domain-containing protein [Casimicrobiaceae bacterium]|nr:trypsin-like peptidase domain-containing protein [Casimicrobiaceae bacterium]MDW8312598.1 trypsin-like peptidase domain-containing protein [Burkholderiales bacterium]